MTAEAWLTDLTDRFEFNLGRVGGIIDASERLGAPGAGRPSVQRTDLLRSAVLFLHAALEDLLRGVAEERLPSAGGEVLERIPLVAPGSDRPSLKFSLRELAAFRGETVSSVIREAVNAHLRHANYNNTAEIANLLNQIGFAKEGVKVLLRRRSPTELGSVGDHGRVVGTAASRRGRGRPRPSPRGERPRASAAWIFAVDPPRPPLSFAPPTRL